MRRVERGWLAAERQREIVRLIVDEKLTFQAAGERMGISKQRAHALFQQAKRATASDGIPKWRDQGVKFADEMVTELLAKARDPRTPARDVAALYREVREFEAHKAKLVGSYSPAQKEVKTLSDTTVEQALQLAQNQLDQLQPHIQYQVIREIP
jgi:Sigma-70, region 4